MPLIYVTRSPAEALRVGADMLVLNQGRIIQQGEPRDIFNQPQSPEVAHIVGAENIFRGIVLEQDAPGGVTTVDLGGCRLRIVHQALTVGTPVIVGVSADDILLARGRIEGTSARNVLDATVKQVVPRGGKAQVVVFCWMDMRVNLTTESVEELGLSPGAPVHLLIKAHACRTLG